MSLKTLAFKTALLGGFVMAGLVYEPALAASQAQNADQTVSDDEMMHHECGEAPMLDFESNEMEFDGWSDDPFEDALIEPDNIELVIESNSDIYTQIIYFAPDSTDLSEPAAMILNEIAADLQTSEIALISIVEGTTSSDSLQAGRFWQVATAFDQAGVPASWVQIDQPLVLVSSL